MTAARTSVLITGGGTAGHTNPGIAVAQALVNLGVPRSSIHFVGGERGNEAELVGEAGFSIDLLPGRGLQRRLTLDNVSSVVALIRGLSRAVGIVRRRRPAVVMCLGGYAAAGASTAAVLTRTPLVISEQNARASAVNRVMAPFARRCALPYPDTDLPKGQLTGNPIRPAVVAAVRNAKKAEARASLGLSDDRLVVAAWSGSLGARRVNDAVRSLATLWADRDDVAIYHIVGRRDWVDFREHPPELDGARLIYNVVDYEDRMPEVLAAADVAVCRAGASTTGELAVAGLPSILVPLPGAPRDHQTANSNELVEAGGAVRLDDATLDGPALATVLGTILSNTVGLGAMAAAASSVGRPDAAVDVARMLLDIGDIDVPAIAKDTA